VSPTLDIARAEPKGYVRPEKIVGIVEKVAADDVFLWKIRRLSRQLAGIANGSGTATIR
jgi:hypothetical protein